MHFKLFYQLVFISFYLEEELVDGKIDFSFDLGFFSRKCVCLECCIFMCMCNYYCR